MILLIITLVQAVPQLPQQSQETDGLNPLLNDAAAQEEAKEQKKRTLFGPTAYTYGGTRHVGIHPLGFKYVLGYGPLGYNAFVKPVTVLKPLLHTQGWRPIVPAVKPVHVVKPIVPVVPVQPVHQHPHLHFQPVHHVHSVVQPIRPVVPIEKPVVPVIPQQVVPVKPFVPLPLQASYAYPFFKPLYPFQQTIIPPPLQIQPPVIHHPQVVNPFLQHPQYLPQPHHVHPLVHQHPLLHQHPLVHQHPFIHQQTQHPFQIPLPGLPNPVGPIEHTNSVHTSFSATYPKNPILGVHTPPQGVPLLPAPNAFPIQPHLHPGLFQHSVFQIMKQYPQLIPFFKQHITPLYPINPQQIPVAEVPRPILPPVTIHHPTTTHDSGVSVQIPSHLPEHPNYHPQNHYVPQFHPLQPENTDQQIPNVVYEQHHGNSDNPLFFPQPQPQPEPQLPQPEIPSHGQTPLYLPPHPHFRQRNNEENRLSELGAHQPSISLEPPYGTPNHLG